MGIIARQSIKGTLVNYIGVGVGAFTTFFVLTRVLTAEEIGLTRILVDASTLLAGLAQLGTNASAMRFYPHFKDDKNNDHGFFFWSLLVPAIGFLLYGLLFWILRVPINSLFAEKSTLFVDYYNFIFPLAFLILYSAIFETNASILMRIAVPKFIKEVLIRVLTLGTYLLYAFKVLDFDGFVVAFCSVYGIATCANVLYLLSIRKISFKPDFKFITPELKKEYLFYTLFLITAALSGSITPFINSFFISMKMGLTYTGVFTIALYLAGLIEIPYRSLGAISRPLIAAQMRKKDIVECNRLAKNVSLHQLLIGGFIFFFLWINLDLIFDLLPNGENYKAAKSVAFILGFTRLFHCTLNIESTVLSYSKYYYLSLISAAALTVSAILLNNLLIPIWGMNGAVIASLIAYVIQYVIVFGVVLWKEKVSPFSMNQLKCLLVFLGLFLLDFLWSKTLTPWFYSLFDSALWSEVVNSVLKTIVLGTLGLTAVYRWHISENIDQVIQKYIHKIPTFDRKK